MSNKNKAIKNIGFIFATLDQSWLGAKNYYRSLFGAMQLANIQDLKVKIFCGAGSDQLKQEFPKDVLIIETALLKKFALAWWLDKFLEKALGSRLLLRMLMKWHRVDVFSHTDPELSGSTPCISWIPDFQHFHLPQFFSAKEVENRNHQYKRLIVQSRFVIVSSHSAKKDLEQFLPNMGSKVKVLRFCPNPIALPTYQSSTDALNRYGLVCGGYFYVPNQLWAHKNHALLIDALAILKAADGRTKVVCTGSLKDPRNPGHLEAIKTKIHELKLEEDFILLGLVPYTDIANLMIGSAAVINPSFFEGWSTTVEEAKALGVPLMLSDIPVHREQGLHVDAKFFNPRDPQQLSEKMLESMSVEYSLSERMRSAELSLLSHQTRILDFALEYRSIVNDAIDFSG